MDKLTTTILKNNLEPIIKTSSLWKGKNIRVYIIVNPVAGGFSHAVASNKNVKILESFAKEASLKEDLVQSYRCVAYESAYAGNVREFTQKIINVARNAAADDDFLIVTAGGDGTSLEVQSALVENAISSDFLKEVIKNQITVLRFPFGTGNDASDGRTLDASLSLLTKSSVFTHQSAVRVTYENYVPILEFGYRGKGFEQVGSLEFRPPWYSFNIASVGIDAYIAHMTNKTKGLLSGDFYKLWVNLAALFYGTSFPQKSIKVEVFDADGQLLNTYNETLEFALLGVSGHRTYGSNHLILPHDATFCATQKMSIFNRIKYMKDFETGNHVNCPFSSFADAQSIKIDYNEYLLLQLDGEIRMLHPKNFPLYMERTEPLIRIIKAV